MSALLAWRVLKWLGILAFGAGCFGSALARDARDRAIFAYALASGGWILAWIAGYGMMKGMALTMGAPWIAYGMVASFLGLLGCVLRAQGVLPPATAGLAVGGVAASAAAMALRTLPLSHAWATGIGLAAAGLTAGAVLARGDVGEPSDPADARAWFAWVGRLEGLSLLALFGVYMPAKYLAHVELDGGQGWFGWVHGMLFVSYVVALVAAARLDRWPVTRAGLAFAASLVPFGTFIFEARVLRAREPAR